MLEHVAFIMDGNRRWAREHHLPLIAGHTKGYQAIEPLIAYAVKREIKYLTFWAFSTENWNREKKEVEVLLQIFRKLFVSGIVDRLHKNGVKINILGNIDAFPKDIARNIKKLIEKTKNNTAITVNIGLNYGGREEILRAVNGLIEDHCHPDQAKRVEGSFQQSTFGEGDSSAPLRFARNDTLVTEEEFSKYLYTAGQPDPDLIIRTSGEQRLSGFLPWQSVYSELYFPKVYWPDFDEKEFEKAFEEFENRQRRFGT